MGQELESVARLSPEILDAGIKLSAVPRHKSTCPQRFSNLSQCLCTVLRHIFTSRGSSDISKLPWLKVQRRLRL